MTSPTDRELLGRMVTAMVADRAMVFPFFEAFRPQLESVARRHLRELGRQDLAADGDEVYGLAMEVALELQVRCGPWRPDGGALPWNWAHRAIRDLVVRVIGHARADVEVESVPEAPDADGLEGPGEFAGLASRDPVAGLLRRAIDKVASPRDAEVHIEYQVQQASGDPSPANTVASRTGLSPANVRQINHRVRKRLVRLVADDVRFAALRGLPWIEGDGCRPPQQARSEAA